MSHPAISSECPAASLPDDVTRGRQQRGHRVHSVSVVVRQMPSDKIRSLMVSGLRRLDVFKYICSYVHTHTRTHARTHTGTHAFTLHSVRRARQSTVNHVTWSDRDFRQIDGNSMSTPLSLTSLSFTAVFSFHGDSGCIYLPSVLPLRSTAAAAATVAAAAASAEVAAALPATRQHNTNDVQPVARVYR
jgi:hypothetical protein